MNRRQMLAGAAATTLTAGCAGASARAEGAKQVMPWEWVEKQGEVTHTDGTPLQFMPKTPKDPNPLENELQKYPRCPYCGMDRTKFSHSRHLIQYSDDLVDGTCSIHCAAISLSLNLDRGPKTIWAGDAGAAAEVKPLIAVDSAHYILNPDQRGTMTARRKFAYGDADKAKEAAGPNGEVVDFDAALTAAYLDMAKDTLMIRKNRAEKRARGKG